MATRDDRPTRTLRVSGRLRRSVPNQQEIFREKLQEDAKQLAACLQFNACMCELRLKALPSAPPPIGLIIVPSELEVACRKPALLWPSCAPPSAGVNHPEESHVFGQDTARVPPARTLWWHDLCAYPFPEECTTRELQEDPPGPAIEDVD